MKSKIIVALVLSSLILGASFVGGVNNSVKDDTVLLPKEHRNTVEFDAWASEVSYAGSEWQMFEATGCVNNWEAGQPAIPYMVVNLKVPNDIKKIDVRFSSPRNYFDVNVVPVGPNYYIGMDILDTHRPIVDRAIYDNDAVFPAKSYNLVKVGEGKDDDGRMIVVYNLLIYPFRCNPARAEATLYEKCDFSLYFDDTVRSFPAPRAVAEKYIVLTSAAINNSAALKPLLDWKTKKGLPAKSYDVAWIAANYPGYDTAEKMRNFLKDKYYNASLEWVQLIGDTDLVPTRECKNPWPSAGYDDNWMPADTYFGSLDANSTWDAYNSDHIYGELFDVDNDQQWDHYDMDDAWPDVWVARFASNDIGRTTTWVNNVVAYEKNPTAGNWMDTCMLLAPDAGAAGSAEFVKNKIEEYVYKNNNSQYGFLGALYGNNGGSMVRLYEANGTLSHAAVVNAISAGCAFGTWIAHGDPSSIQSSISGTLLASGDAGTMTNGGKKPVLFAMSCLTGWFDGQECLAEALTENNLPNGAIGYVGSARITLANVNYGYQPTGVGIQMDFMYQMELGKTLDATKLYMGKALGAAKRGFADVWFPFWEVATKAFFEYNLFGETNCPIWHDQPKMFNPLTVVSEDASGKTVNITVRDANNNTRLLNHTLVCLEAYAQGVYMYTETGDNGLATFRVPSAVGDGNFTITRADYKPSETTASLIDTFSPYTCITVTPPNADGKNGVWRTAPKISLSAEPGATTFCRWDNNPFGQYAMQLTATEGTHMLQFYSKDWKGNEEGTREQEFKVDSIMPVTNITVTPATPDGFLGWYRTAPTVKLECDDAGGPTIKYKWDTGSVYEDYTELLTVPEGKPTLFFYAGDLVGNNETARSLSFKVDSAAPLSSVIVNPTAPDGRNGWYKTSPSISFLVENTNDWVRFHWDNDGDENYTSGNVLKAPEGEHTVYFRGYDDAGNDEELHNLTLKVDSKTPTTTITTDPETPDGSNSWYITVPKITFNIESGALAFYKWDLGEFVCATGAIDGIEGVHTLYYYSVDAAGNRESNKKVDMKVDSMKPSTNLTITPADKGNDWYTKKPKAKLENDGNATTYYYWDTQTDNIQTYTKEIDVPEGEHILHFYSKDDAGNKEMELAKDFKVDSILPSVAVSISKTVLAPGDTITFNISGTDANGIDKFYLDYGDGVNTGWTEGDSFTHRYPTVGNYTIIVRARDTAGNEAMGSQARITVEQAVVPPPPPPGPGPTASTNGWLLPAGAAIGVIAAVGVGAFAFSRRKKGREDEQNQKASEDDKKLKENMPAYNWAKPPEEGSAFRATISEEAVSDGGAASMAAAPAMASIPEVKTKASNCPKCGNEVEPGAEYCYTCGERWGSKNKKVEEEVMYAPKEAPAYTPPSAPAVDYSASRPTYVEPKEAPEDDYVPAPKAQTRDWYAEVQVPQPKQGQESSLNEMSDIMSRLDSMSKPAESIPEAPATAVAAPAVAYTAPAAPAAPPKPSVTQMAAGSAAAGTGKMCPKCGNEMVRLVELPGAQMEMLKKLAAKGQHAFQCNKCNHFEISKWAPK